jgi:hypothetical protein
MPQALELSRPRITQAQPGVRLDPQYTITISSVSVAGNADVRYVICRDRALRGEDYPALVTVWDNDVDAIYDTL